MELFIDTADLELIKKAVEYFPLDGITTNPAYTAAVGMEVKERIAEYKELVEEYDLKMFFQLTADLAEDMYEQAKKLYAYFGDHLVVKIPTTREGFKAAKMIKADGIKVCVTIVYSLTQAIIAAKAGADYIAPYISHMDDWSQGGIRMIERMVKAIENGGYDCKVLGASVRTIGQVGDLAVVGGGAVTMDPPLFFELMDHPGTDRFVAFFKDEWKKVFGDMEVTDLLPDA